MKNIFSYIFCFLIFNTGLLFSQNAVITINQGASITITSNGENKSNLIHHGGSNIGEIIVNSGASLTTWGPEALINFNVSGNGDIYLPVEPSSLAEKIPEQFALRQNYPNPFNPQTTIVFELPEKDFATVDVLDLQGRLIKRLADNSCEAGRHSISWYGNNQKGDKVASGVYIVTIKTGKFIDSKKMLKIQ